MRSAQQVEPGSFEVERHYYERVRNAQIHPMMQFFQSLGTNRIIQRYCHLHPEVDRDRFTAILHEKPGFFRWAGADLFAVTSDEGNRHMVLVETNSCPSGQKSFPLLDPNEERGGYLRLLEGTFRPLVKKKHHGGLAVIYDKNKMENTGYASVMADVFDEPVWLAEFHHHDEHPPVRFDEQRWMEVRDEGGEWHRIRGAFRYVTQRPWNRIPQNTKTALLNPIICCLAGGRNKLVASKAYDFFNAEMEESGLEIRAPETIWDVGLTEVPLWLDRMGGFAVVKNPYSNAGQGVYTITSAAELERFMALEHRYDKFIVQSLVGNSGWSSTSKRGRLYHVGTVPDRKSRSYVSDLRLSVHFANGAWRPLAFNCRRARLPLVDHLEDGVESWDILGTNLSILREDGTWASDTDRLLLMDRRDFNIIGLGLDDMIEAFVQTVMATLAVDHMARNLVNSKGAFRRRLFRNLDNDPSLLAEIL